MSIKYFCDGKGCGKEVSSNDSFKDYAIPLERFKTKLTITPLLGLHNHFCMDCESEVWKEIFVQVNKELERLEAELAAKRKIAEN